MEIKAVKTQPTFKQRYQDLVNKAAVVATPMVLAASAHAEVDTGAAVTQLAFALGAVAALGAAKLAPAALTWVWALVTRTASRT